MRNHRKISVSVMCSDLMSLGREIQELEKCGVDYLHIDIMDAHLVPNLTFGPDFINAMRACSGLPLDIHLMVEDPELVLAKFELKPDDILSVHVELERDIASISRGVRSRGAYFGLAVNPETPIEALEKHLSITDVVILMLVRPGFARGTLIDGILDKVARTRAYLDQKGFPNIEISVDGSVSCERAHVMAQMGASIFVGGTAGIYRKGLPLETTVRSFRDAISLASTS